ncbi:hypothetical protein E2542_SST07635 [Spatholobus suberectus]|nr:hypothetical protein E2542_SST07635 [Spatholobus suberectus]
MVGLVVVVVAVVVIVVGSGDNGGVSGSGGDNGDFGIDVADTVICQLFQGQFRRQQIPDILVSCTRQFRRVIPRQLRPNDRGMSVPMIGS